MAIGRDTVSIAADVTVDGVFAIHDVLDAFRDTIDSLLDAVDQSIGIDNRRGDCVRWFQLERLKDRQSILEIVGDDIDEV